MGDTDLKVKITTESSGLDTGMKEASATVNQAVSTMRSSFTSLGSTLSTLKDSWALLSIGINQALEIFNKVTQLPRQMIEWADMGAVVMRTETAFNQVAKAAGYMGDEVVKAMVHASGGTMDASDTMKRAGRLMQEGINPEQLVSMMELLRKQAPVVGDTIQEAWDKIGLALTTGNMRMVKQYVGLIDLERELSKYAATLGVTKDRLTEEAKQAVIFEAVHKALLKTTQDLTVNTESYSNSMGRSKATIKEAWEDIYKAMVPVGDLLLKISAFTLSNLAPKIDKNAFNTGELTGGMMTPEQREHFSGATPGSAAGGEHTAGPLETSPPAKKSPIAERTPEQEAAWQSFRIKNEAEILQMQNDQRGAIIARQQAEMAGELDKEKRVELAKRQAVELAEFDKKAAFEVERAKIESFGIAADEQQKTQDEVARIEADQRRVSREAAQKETEETIRIRGEALDRESEMVATAIQQDVQKRREMEAQGLQNTITLANQATATAVEYFRNRFDLGEINAIELARVERELGESRYQIETESLDRLQMLWVSMPEKYQEVLNKMKMAKETHAAEIQAIDQKLALDNKQTWAGLLSPIHNAFSTSIKGIIMGTQTLKQGLNNLFQNILASFVDGLVKKMVGEWLLGEAVKLNISQIYSTIKKALWAEEAVTATETKAAEATSLITMDAAVGAAGAASSQASIPYIGPILAVAAAGAMMAMIMGFMSSIKSAEGGWDVDRGAITQLHAQEMVLPANLATGVRNLVAEGDSRGGSVKLNPKTFQKIGEAFGRGQGQRFNSELRSAVRRFRR